MSDLKTCFKCNQPKPLECFYAHPRMKDGRVNKCKECNKKDVRDNYELRRDQYRAYEAFRRKTPKRQRDHQLATIKHRKSNPLKYKARTDLNNALRDGRVQKQPCPCGNLNSQAHHHDYTKPLDVEWLCLKCHRDLHKQSHA